MRNELDSLWHCYLIEKAVKHTYAEEKIIVEFINSEKRFRSTLNKEQQYAFEEYDRNLSKLNSMSEKNAFIKGVRFATKFLIEVLY